MAPSRRGGANGRDADLSIRCGTNAGNGHAHAGKGGRILKFARELPQSMRFLRAFVPNSWPSASELAACRVEPASGQRLAVYGPVGFGPADDRRFRADHED